MPLEALGLKRLFADTSEWFGIGTSARSAIAFLALPGRKGMGSPQVGLCLFPCVCSCSCCCSHREVLVVWGSGCTNSSSCCFYPLFASQLLNKRDFMSFSLKPGKQRQICLGNFFCPPCSHVVLPVEGTGINPVIMCFLCHKLLLFECLVTSNHISVQHNSVSEFSSGANGNVVSLHTVQLWDACLEDASVQLKTQPVKLIPI